ncbi:MAG: hypothetical protein IT260_19335, partial [Saprospiraceae bacterium]|nr:hypothetical protein [Saprospiraceae bacterium]
FRLYRYGQQEPIFTSTEGIFTSTDFFEFFGERNRDALDRHLFENPDAENLNPWYSLFNDTSAYYLVWDPSTPALRYTAVPNDLSNPPAPKSFCWFSTGYAYSNYLFKRQISDEITYSWFNGDGFATYPEPDFSANIVPRKLMPGGPDATLNVRYGCGLGQHQQQVSLNDSLLASDAFTGFGIRQHALSVPTAQLVVNNKVRFKSAFGGNDRNAVAGIFLRYPRLLDFENANSAEFFLDGSGTAKYLEIQAFNAAGGAPVLYDLSRRLRLETLVQNNLVKVLLPAASSAQRLWLSSVGAGITVVTSLSPVQFRDYRPEAAEYIILSNAALYQDPEHNGANQVEAYAAYRRSPEGGGYKVTVVDVNELYDQFGYGVRFHPLALRNFLQYVEQQWPDPRFLLIIGKGLEYAGFRNPNTQKLLADSLFFVPTYGAPGADQLLVMAQKKLSAPLLSVGRLAVTKPSEILQYLEKVKEHEQAYLSAPQTLEGKAWMKRVIHNSGGLSGEQAGIRTYVESMAAELAQNRVGADIYTYYKTSNDPIQLSSYEQMLQLIDGGVSMWMIYGHSSPNAVDFDIGTPNAYHNKGRYPLMMIMGCFSGQCSLPQKGIGEQFVLAPERGAIAYFASVNFSFIEALHTFGKQYYQQLGGADYGRSIGEVLSHTVAELQPTNYAALAALLHQSLLQGDPAVHLHHYPGPDYVIDPQTLRFDPNPVSVEQASLHLDVDVVNLGEHTADSLAIRVVQRRPDGAEVQRLLDTVPGPAFRQPLSRLLPTAGSQLGFNRFLLSLDPQNAVAEQPLAAEFNNELTDATGQTGVDLYFFADDVAPIAPEDFGIVRQTTITLRASTLNFNAAPTRYLFELDTLEKFNSPFRMAAQVVQRGGLIEWKVPKDLEDNKVYYWRVARDSLVNGQVPWRVRSFICRNGSAAGWNQSHFGQFAQDVFVNLEALGTSRSLEFVNSTGLASLNVAYRNIDRYPGMQNAYYEGFFGDAGLNGQGFQRGVLLMVQNPNTGHLIPNLPGSPYNSSTKTKPFFAFDTRDSLGRRALMDFIAQEIPTDYVVGLLAFQPYNDTVGYAPRRWARDSIAFGKNLFQ